jgi:hypothetical protein
MFLQVNARREFHRHYRGIVGFFGGHKRTGLAFIGKSASLDWEMDWEKDLIDAFEAMVNKDFPNPQRIGCPGHDSLVKLSSGSRGPEFAATLAHIRQCGPCFEELKQLRRTQGRSGT